MSHDFAQNFSLADRTVLITGASSGIGAHLARIAARAGARVVLAARRVDRLEQVARDVEWECAQVLSVALDVTDRASVEAAFDAAEARFGVVDVVLNNAGIGNGQRPLELARYRIRVNAIAPGYFKTEMNAAFFESDKAKSYIRDLIPMRRLGQLHELEGPFLLLASDAGGFMTGSVLTVDGGHLVSSI
ncbi:SDR family oxidoreductase [Pseudomonas sp. W17]|uniref:SDR family oxidoreductase n=1 Tax=Pseudomonas sp. W17 TaxID=3144407 RepID=A0AAU7X603_9PSED